MFSAGRVAALARKLLQKTAMKILIIGGTQFLGWHLATAALARQHEVTLFHRGRHSAAGPASVEEVFGDGNDDLDQLKNGRWDAVIDTCGYLPQTARAAAETLQNAVQQYVFISNFSAHADFSAPD